MMSPLYHRLSTEYEGVRFYTVNIDELTEAAAQNGVVGEQSCAQRLAAQALLLSAGCRRAANANT